MKAINHKTITRKYIHFSIGMLICISLTIFSFLAFAHTSHRENEKISEMTKRYDDMYVNQIHLTEKVDSLSNYIQMLGGDDYINQQPLQRIVSERKMQLSTVLSNDENKDAILYKKLSNQINDFLSTKEDIRRAVIDENLVKGDLQRCIEDNKEASRKLKIGSISLN